MSSIATPVVKAASRECDFASHPLYRPDIDGLRAVAVLSVLAFHAFPAFLPGGFVGVDVFFVISGFLITKVILDNLALGIFSIADFYARRVRRIFPALIVVLLGCLAFGWKTLLAEDLTQLSKHVFAGATFSSNLVLWNEAGYFDKASEAKPLLHLWSLGIEEQFYLAWPVMLWAAMRFRIRAGVLLAVAMLASFSFNIAWVKSHPTATFYSPLSRAWELLVGAVLAHGLAAQIVARSSRVQRNWLGGAGAAMVVAALVLLSPSDHFPGWWAILPSVGTALLIAAGPKAWVNRAVLSRQSLVAIGLISFPLYLWHWPLLTLGQSLVPDSGSGRIMLLAASFLLAFATYRLIEKPLRFGSYLGAKVLVLTGAVVIVACMAATIYRADGFPSRYPEIIQNATQYDLKGYRAGIRYRRCFLELDQGAEFGAECIERGDKPLLALWGDSGAGTLYAGMHKLRGFRIAQFTSSSCPPIMAFRHPQDATCKDKNRKALSLIAEAKPKVVLLNAIWLNYPAAITSIGDTIRQLRELGVDRVIVVGPVPAWGETPSHIVLKLWKEDPLHAMPSAYLDQERYGYTKDGPGARQRITKELREAAAVAGAEYISAWDAMCQGSSCLMRASSQSGASFYLDIVHLNRAGAEYLVQAIAPQIYGP